MAIEDPIPSWVILSIETEGVVAVADGDGTSFLRPNEGSNMGFNVSPQMAGAVIGAGILLGEYVIQEADKVLIRGGNC